MAVPEEVDEEEDGYLYSYGANQELTRDWLTGQPHQLLAGIWSSTILPRVMALCRPWDLCGGIKSAMCHVDWIATSTVTSHVE